MPENENTPRKKRRALWVIIIILIILLAATIGGYALAYYNALPAWVADMLPNPGFSSAEPAATPVVPMPTEEETEPSPSLSPTASPALSGEEESSVSDGSKEETVSVSGNAAESTGNAAQTAPVITAVPYIGADAAADAALEHSKVAEKDADFSSVLLKEQNGMMLYEVVFTAVDYRYEYYIDSTTGRVESWRKSELSAAPGEDALAAASLDKPTDQPADKAADPAGSSTNKTGGTSQNSGTVLLGEDEAKKLAMAHANITDKDISTISCKIELQGLSLIYEVDMKTKLMEYEYEIDAITGDIIGFDAEPIKSAA